MSLNLELIAPFGVRRSHQPIPCMMLYVASVAMIGVRLSQRINATWTAPMQRPIAITNSTPRVSSNQLSSGPSTNDDATTQIVIAAPTDTSNALTINALVCAIAASPNGRVATIRPSRLNEPRNDASWLRV